MRNGRGGVEESVLMWADVFPTLQFAVVRTSHYLAYQDQTRASKDLGFIVCFRLCRAET